MQTIELQMNNERTSEAEWNILFVKFVKYLNHKSEKET